MSREEICIYHFNNDDNIRIVKQELDEMFGSGYHGDNGWKHDGINTIILNSNIEDLESAKKNL